jgi:hypothetical protein
MAQLRRISEVFPGAWPVLAKAVQDQRGLLFGKLPTFGPIDISDVAVPPDAMAEIKTKNLRRVRNEIGVEEMTADGSPYVTDAYFDDQLLEVVASIAHEYHPLDFIQQMVRFIEIFVNESAALRTGLVSPRIKDEDADRAVLIVRTAAEKAKDGDTRQTLEFLLTDLTEGGTEPWVPVLSPENRNYLAEVLKRRA